MKKNIEPVPVKDIFHKLTIEDLDIRGKRVFIRADFNVPLDDNLQITDDRRIRSTIPTINYAIDEGAKVIISSHLGRPKGKIDPKYSLAPVAKRLQRLLNKEVLFSPDCIGTQVENIVSKMKEGDVLLLENLRYYPGEEKNDEEFAKSLARLADVFVNDAFGAAHRAHASIVGVAKFLPSAAGFLLKKEVEYLKGAVENPIKPFIAILGGAKVSGKIGVSSTSPQRSTRFWSEEAWHLHLLKPWDMRRAIQSLRTECLRQQGGYRKNLWLQESGSICLLTV